VTPAMIHGVGRLRGPAGGVVRHRWFRLLYNQSARRLNSALVGREQSVIADGPIVAVTHRQQSCNGIGGG